MVAISTIIALLVGGFFALIGFGTLFGFLTYHLILPRIKPGWAVSISQSLMTYAFARLPGYGIAAHQNEAGEYNMTWFDVKDGEIWIQDRWYAAVDEVKIGTALGVPFLVSYSGFAGLVNAGLAKAGEEIQRRTNEIRGGVSTATDGGEANTKGMAIDIPERAIVDTAKIKFLDMNASLPDKATRAVRNAEQRARADMDMTPMKMAMIVIGAFVLGAGVVILGLVLVGSVGGSGSSSLSLLPPVPTGGL